MNHILNICLILEKCKGISRSKIEIDFTCRKAGMIKVNYENPKGEKNHNNLWNGGEAEGQIKLYRKQNKEYILADTLYGKYGGCEYGEYE